MSGIYDHLHLRDWPFSVVPQPDRCTYIAGRPQLDADISELLRNLSRRDISSIHVFWSWFGAGKTHSLYYLSNRARTNSRNLLPVSCLPVYTEFPRSVRGFIDLYRAFMASLDIYQVGEAFLEIQTSPTRQSYYTQLLSTNPDLAAALRVFSTGSTQDEITASRWLRGDAVPLADFRKIGISQRISTADAAVRTLASITALLSAAERAKGKHGHRLIWAIDELQRVETAGKRTILDVNAGLHSLFNACPTGLALVLSFSGRPRQATLPSWLSSELKDRIGITKVMIMPPLERTDALRFVTDVLAHFRLPHSEPPSPLFPFTHEACSAILDYIQINAELRPRFIMDAFDAVLQKADPELEAQRIALVTPEFAQDVLNQHVIVSDEPHDH